MIFHPMKYPQPQLGAAISSFANSPTQPPGVLVASKASPIDAEYEGLAKNLAVYEETLAVVYNRLDSVLQPCPPCPVDLPDAKDCPMAHGLVGRLQMLNRKLCQHNAALQDIANRLTL